MKDHEKQQRREEMRTKIISKQQTLIKEVYEYQKKGHSSLSNNSIPSKSPNSFNNESLVKVKIKCIPKKKVEQNQKHSSKVTVITTDEKSITSNFKEDVSRIPENDRIDFGQDQFNAKSYPINRHLENETRPNKYLLRDNCVTERYKYNVKMEEQEKPMSSVHQYQVNDPTSSNHIVRPLSKSVISEPVGSTHAQSVLSTRSSVNSRQKSCKTYVSMIH